MNEYNKTKKNKPIAYIPQRRKNMDYPILVNLLVPPDDLVPDRWSQVVSSVCGTRLAGGIRLLRKGLRPVMPLKKPNRVGW